MRAASMVAVTAVTGGPGGPRAAQAVAISKDEGWTTIRLLDIDADPSAVVHELEAAHIPVTTRTLHRTVGSDGTMTVSSDAQTKGEARLSGFGMMAVGRAGDNGVVGLSVASTGPAPKEPISVKPNTDAGPDTTEGAGDDGPSTKVEGDPPTSAEMEAQGVRFEAGGGVSIKNGSANEVVVYTSK